MKTNTKIVCFDKIEINKNEIIIECRKKKLKKIKIMKLK